MNFNEYANVASRNAKVLKNCLDNRNSDLSDIVFWQGVTGRDISLPKLLSKYNDIIGCCSIGVIPSIETQGADGFAVTADYNVVEFETKVSTIERKNIYIGGRGGLYWSSNPENYNSKSVLYSKFSGRFDAQMTEGTMETKRRHTALICFDSDSNQVIDSWILSPDRAYEEISSRRHNASIDIKLTRFCDYGFKAPQAIPFIGWSKWYQEQAACSRREGRFITSC